MEINWEEKCKENEIRIQELRTLVLTLENKLKENGIPLPEQTAFIERLSSDNRIARLLLDGTYEELKKYAEDMEKLCRKFTCKVTYRDLGIWTMSPKAEIETVASSLLTCLCGTGPLNRVDILKGLSGRILPGKLTLLLGPPGSGSSSIKLLYLLGKLS